VSGKFGWKHADVLKWPPRQQDFEHARLLETPCIRRSRSSQRALKTPTDIRTGHSGANGGAPNRRAADRHARLVSIRTDAARLT